MRQPVEYAVERNRVFLRDVIRPVEIVGRAPLRVEAFQRDEPVPYEEAARADRTPVDLGWRWRPAWSTCRVHLSGEVPSGMAGEGGPPLLRFSTGTEARVWRHDRRARTWHGLDVNREVVPLWFDGAGPDGQPVERADLEHDANYDETNFITHPNEIVAMRVRFGGCGIRPIEAAGEEVDE